MWNVIRAQMYQLKRDKMVWGIFFFALILSGIFTFTNLVDFEGELSGSLVVANMGNMYCITGMIVILVTVANVVGKDFTDKTLNYEILSGHSRREVFFGRFIVAAIAGMVGSFLVMVLIPVVLTLVFGWGTTMNLQGVISRYALVFITLFRIVCELTFVTILTKNPYLTYLTGFVFAYIQFIVSMAKMEFPDWFANKNSVLFSVWHCLDLLNFQDWTTFLPDESGQILFQSAVEPPTVFLSIGTSLTAGVIIMILSYVFFRHSDLN